MADEGGRGDLTRERERLLDIRERLTHRHHARSRAFLDARLNHIERELAAGDKRGAPPADERAGGTCVAGTR